jgi:hypothetical protein
MTCQLCGLEPLECEHDPAEFFDASEFASMRSLYDAEVAYGIHVPTRQMGTDADVRPQTPEEKQREQKFKDDLERGILPF